MSFGQGGGGPFGGPPRDGGGTAGGQSGPFGAFGPFGGAPRGPGDDGDRGPGGPFGGGGSSAARGRGRPGRPSALVLTIIAVAVLVGLFVVFTNVYTDVLWFSQLGFTEVFWTEVLAKAALFLIAGLGMALAVWLAIRTAWRHRPADASAAARDSLSQAQRQLEPIRRLVFLGVPLVLGVFAGSTAMNGWNTVLLFLNQVPYGQADPEFGLDLMFFMATLPFLTLVVGYLI